MMMIEKLMLRLGYVPVAKYRKAADEAAYSRAKVRQVEAAMSTSTASIAVQVRRIGRRAAELVT